MAASSMFFVAFCCMLVASTLPFSATVAAFSVAPTPSSKLRPPSSPSLLQLNLHRSSPVNAREKATAPSAGSKSYHPQSFAGPGGLASSADKNVPKAYDLVGDDAAYFSFSDQKLDEWVKFSVATGTVLAIVAYVWFLPWGPHWGDAFLETIQSVAGTTDPSVTVLGMLAAFAFFHSGLAGLRPYAEEIVGARAWRVVFAMVSLPTALSCISYFVNHAHEGVQLWDVTDVPGLHAALWVANFVSFIFLYPSTFNLLEIAAIQRPQLHLYETGIIRITRHPQAAGQVLWCLAHSIWLGSSTALAASTVLVAHHAFSVYHGDRRLKQRHGKEFDYIQERTSVVPFAAILDGRQVLPPDYYKEFLRGPYLLVVGGTIAAYFAHPFMQSGAALLHW